MIDKATPNPSATSRFLHWAVDISEWRWISAAASAFALALCLGGVAAADEFDDAEAAAQFHDAVGAAKRLDYTTVLQIWRPRAEMGNPSAQLFLGDMYYRGRGGPRNYAEAFRWYRLAADQGDAGGQAALAGMYFAGQSVPTDYAAAAHWYRLAADQGDVGAQNSLGDMYMNRGKGGGVARDDAEAARWYRLAADQGDSDAQFSLGLMYDHGLAIPQNAVQALMWFNLSAARATEVWRRDRAIDSRDDLARKMTPGQIAEAQRLTAEWKAR